MWLAVPGAVTVAASAGPLTAGDEDEERANVRKPFVACLIPASGNGEGGGIEMYVCVCV